MKTLLDTVEPDIRVDGKGYMSYGKDFTMDEAQDYLSSSTVEWLLAECRKQAREEVLDDLIAIAETRTRTSITLSQLRRMAEGETK